MSTAQSNNNNYTTGQYQTAIDHCTLVTRSQDHSKCCSHAVQGNILPKIDDDIDNALGLAVGGSWWTDNLNLVRNCVDMLHTFSLCLNGTCYPHYFVNILRQPH